MQEQHSAEQGEYVVAVLQNAHDLVVDAEVLLRGGRWARAFALATFAMEEAGKAWRAEEHLSFTPAKKIPRLQHEEKLAAAREMTSLFLQLKNTNRINLDEWFSDAHEHLAETDFNTRMAGLYVDFKGGKTVGGPGSVARALAEETVALAGQVVHIAKRLLWAKYGGSVATNDQVAPQG